MPDDSTKNTPPAPQNHRASQVEGDYYFTPEGLLVFTAEYHLRRGSCCGSGCRHCPYEKND